MNQDDFSSIAAVLDEAVSKKHISQQAAKNSPDLSLTQAYQTQQREVALRVHRGENLIGYKMGLTSKARQIEMQVDHPIFGVLTDKMEVPAGGEIFIKDYIHPKIEPEILFHIKKELKGDITEKEALAACDKVYAALEIVDSRFKKSETYLIDMISDNCAAANFVCSKNAINPKKISLSDLSMTFCVNNKVIGRGNSNAILGNPIRSVVALSKILAAQNKSIPAGSVVLAGSALPAIPLKKGMVVSLTVLGIGEVSIRVK